MNYFLLILSINLDEKTNSHTSKLLNLTKLLLSFSNRLINHVDEPAASSIGEYIYQQSFKFNS